MRKLYHVPILHMSADMGSLAPSLDETANADLGQEVWQKHKEAVSSFWDCIAQFFNALDVKGFKIYQDGMVADGADGLRIIREGISQGSKNYEIIGKLLERGAVLVKTEDPTMVKQEYTYIAKIAHAKSRKEKEVWALRYKLAQGDLLRQRDDFIAKRIQETLAEGESGILFSGAYHDISSRLPDDIQVTQVKDVGKIKEYHKTLASTKKYSQGLQRLALYLTSPISKTSS
jgi:hypothetical protein